ncbi:MAG: lytic transglycosylase domain-containing protein [Blastocatellia bacterium]
MVLTKTKYAIKMVSLLVAIVIALTSIGASNTLAQAKKSKSRSSFDGLSPELAQEIITTANYYGLDPYLLFEVIKQESGFNPKATSSKNARGLMQMIPSTAKRFGVRDAYDPRDNLAGGCRYLVWLLRRYNGRLDLALAGYNAGEGAVERYGNRVPPYQETRDYVRSITSKYVARLKAKPVVSKQYVVSSISNLNKSIKATKPTKLSKPINSSKLTKKELNKLATLDGYFGKSLTTNSNSNKDFSSSK